MKGLNDNPRTEESSFRPRVIVLLFSASLALLAVLLMARSAPAHVNPYPPSLNPLGNVVWYEVYPYTKWDNYMYRGGDIWSGSFAGKPNVARYSSTSGAGSVQTFDYYQANTSTVALWQSSTSPDTIKFNDWWMVDFYNNPYWANGNALIQITVTHEFGHALDFNHASAADANDDNYFCAQSVLYFNVTKHYDCGGRGGLGRHDTFDWGNRW